VDSICKGDSISVTFDVIFVWPQLSKVLPKIERIGPENRMSGSGMGAVLEKIQLSGRSHEREQSGERAESAIHNPLIPNSLLIS